MTPNEISLQRDESLSDQNLEKLLLKAWPPMSLDRFMEQSGLSPCTCWRYRKKGWLEVITIARRHYVTREAIAKFNKRAASGEFAGTIPNPSAHRVGKAVA